MIILDAFLRFSGVGIALMVCFILKKNIKHSSSMFYLFLLNISTVSHFLGFTPDVFQLPYSLQMGFRFLDIFQVPLIWLFALSLFEKDFNLSRFHILVCSGFCFLVFMERLVQFEFIENLPAWWAALVNGLTLLIILHMVTVTLLGRSDDLIEKRRKSRIYLVLICAFSAIAVTVLGSIIFHEYQATVTVISIWPAIILISFWLLDIDNKKFLFDEAPNELKNELSFRDRNLQEKLNRQLDENQCFLEKNLSIETLAKRLGVAEHRLREFINQTLGYKNFSTFINVYRISAIKEAFRNSDNKHIPILSIALDHGFNSLSPFNRAFKKIEGITPTEFRNKIK